MREKKTAIKRRRCGRPRSGWETSYSTIPLSRQRRPPPNGRPPPNRRPWPGSNKSGQKMAGIIPDCPCRVTGHGSSLVDLTASRPVSPANHLSLSVRWQTHPHNQYGTYRKSQARQKGARVQRVLLLFGTPDDDPMALPPVTQGPTKQPDQSQRSFHFRSVFLCAV